MKRFFKDFFRSFEFWFILITAVVSIGGLYLCRAKHSTDEQFQLYEQVAKAVAQDPQVKIRLTVVKTPNSTVVEAGWPLEDKVVYTALNDQPLVQRVETHVDRNAILALGVFFVMAFLVLLCVYAGYHSWLVTKGAALRSTKTAPRIKEVKDEKVHKNAVREQHLSKLLRALRIRASALKKNKKTD